MYYSTDFHLIGELLEFLNFNKKLNFDNKMALLSKVLSPIDKFLKLKLYHGDLKPENLLINDNFKLILCDLGTVSYIDDHNFNTDIYSHNYASPEFRKSRRNGKLDKEKCEVYSVGVIFYLILRMKFPDEDSVNITKEIKLFKGS